MNSEITNNLTLSAVTPVKTDSGSQSSNNQSSGLNQAVATNQNQNNQALSLDAVKKAAENSSQLFQDSKLSVEYGVDPSTKEYVLKIIDPATGKLVRQIPSAEMLDFVKRIQDIEAKQTGAVIQTSA